MSDKSSELQNLLIQQLLAENNPAKTTEPSSFGTVGVIILISVIIIIGGVVIYYIYLQNLVKPYPLSPFKDGQTVVIRPAILSDVNGNIENQYLAQVKPPDFTYSYPDGGKGVYMGSGSSALQFIGNKNDATSQWILEQHNADGTLDANQSLQYGLGNRFFLRNKSNPDVSDLAGRVRFQATTQQAYVLCPSVTSAVIGSNDYANWYNTELVIYFYPTNYKDIYYLLFPNCVYTGDDTTTSPNNGLATIRPFSKYIPSSFINNYSTCTGYDSDPPCDPNNSGLFVPYTGNGTELYNNIMLMNYLPPLSLLPPYPNPNVTLFKVTLA